MIQDHHSEHGDDPEYEGVRVTDRRRIDPETGAVRPPAGVPAAGMGSSHDAGVAADSAGVGDEPVEAQAVDDAADAIAEAEASVATAAAAIAAAQVAELTADLQRLAAEYKNYRDRVQRELGETQTRGRADVVNELIPTLDDLDRAAEHGDLEGPVKALAENLSAALGRLGVERYGTVGEPFDPVVHEAMTHAAGEGLDGPTVTAVYQPGYRLGERVIRAARVAVTE